MESSRENTFVAKEAAMDRVTHYWMSGETGFCLYGIIGLEAPLSDNLIEKTLSILIHQVPILTSRLNKGLWNGYWGYSDPGDIKKLITRLAVSDNEGMPDHLERIVTNPIDPLTSPLIRVTSIDGPDDHYLVLQIHHIAMDGEGAKQLFTLFAQYYSALEKAPDWKPEKRIDMNRSWRQLAAHLKWHRLLITPFYAMTELIKGLFTISKFGSTTSVICGDSNDESKSTTPDAPCTATISISSTDMAPIKNELMKGGFTINDYLMAALMITVNQWNSKYPEPFSHVLSGYTINCRRWLGQPKGTFANMSAVNYAVARTDQLSSLPVALKTLKPGFDKAKKSYGLRELWDMVSLRFQIDINSQLVVFLIKRLVKKIHTLTNIGIIPECAGDFGSVKAISYSINAPVMTRPCVLITATSFKEGLTLHANFNETHMEKKTMAEFMAALRQNLLYYA